ncbi:coiled-coil domain-containing protein 189 isoform X3 [Pseudoliparis swirei]|uniref:coiled-coil domain-containing protein 189 isoform X3 n=1 Tax=Pseudoliparis swirei TaxID=2059687 RepID=UPI0024BE0B6C|nr:coiled-coil domain-containing protein 189 isoform X3 [Pseudoliparis swirei]
MDPEWKVPHALKAKVMLWSDVSYHGMEEIDKMQCLPDLERLLSLSDQKHFSLNTMRHDVHRAVLCGGSALCSVLEVQLPEPRRGVLLEMYVHTVGFCRESNFKKEQTSALLSILRSIHEANIGTPLNNIEQCSTYCTDLVLCHSVRRPPFSINLFSSEEVACILKYIHNSYLRHYKLYKYIFTPQVKLDLSLTYSGTPDQDEPPMEDSSDPADIENVLEKETEAAATTDSSPQTQEESIEDPEAATADLKSELKALIEKEVREQMALVCGQLEQRMKGIAESPPHKANRTGAKKQ